MKTILFLILLTVTSLAAQGSSNCQRPDAHMDPNCNPSPSGPTSMPSSGQDNEINLVGSYAVQGKSPDGSEYEGSVVISGDEASGYQVQWTIGPDQYTGTGKLSGTTFTVDWGAPEPIVYKAKKDRTGTLKLDGRWGKKGKGREKLSKLPS